MAAELTVNTDDPNFVKFIGTGFDPDVMIGFYVNYTPDDGSTGRRSGPSYWHTDDEGGVTIWIGRRMMITHTPGSLDWSVAETTVEGKTPVS